MQKLIAGVAALAVLAVASTASAQSVSDTATASANIVTPLTVQATQNMVFGNILANTGGTVSIASNDNRTSTGSVTLIGGTAPKAAHFHVVGDTIGSATYKVEFTSAPLTGPGTAMPLAVDTANVPSTSGTNDYNVAATLTVNSGQTPGPYSGSITATATYN